MHWCSCAAVWKPDKSPVDPLLSTFFRDKVTWKPKNYVLDCQLLWRKMLLFKEVLFLWGLFLDPQDKFCKILKDLQNDSAVSTYLKILIWLYHFKKWAPIYWKIALFFLFDTHIGSSKHIIKKKSSLPIVFDGDDDAQKYWRMNNCQVARQNYERSIRIKMASSFFKASSSWMCQQIVWSFVEGVADMSTGIKFNSNRST